MDTERRETLIRSQVERLEEMSKHQNERGQVLVHWTHLRGCAAQLRSTLALDAAPPQSTSTHKGDME